MCEFYGVIVPGAFGIVIEPVVKSDTLVYYSVDERLI